MKPLRIGLVGLHDHRHAAPFADAMASITGLDLIAVADEREQLVKDWAEQRGVHWTTDAMALIARDDVDAVILTASNATYADQVEAAATLGRHVLLDKAVLTSLADADRIVAASRRVKVLMAYLLRFVPSYVEVRDAMQKGAIGQLKSGFYSTRTPFEPAREPPGGGLGWPVDLGDCRVGGLLDHGVHFADFFRWFSGSEPTSVVATIGSSACPEMLINDYGIATYTLANGATVTLESTRYVDPDGALPPLSGPDRATVTGTKGEIEFHYQRSPQIEIQGGEGPWQQRRYADEFGWGRSQGIYRNLLIEFRDLITEDRQPSPSATDGRAALEMVLAAYEAANTRSRVSFPYNPHQQSANARSGSHSSRAAI